MVAQFQHVTKKVTTKRTGACVKHVNNTRVILARNIVCFVQQLPATGVAR